MERAPSRFLDALVQELKDHPVNTNVFFQAFKDQHLGRRQLQTFLRQYHYFCKHFVKVLEGLLYKTPVGALEMRVELAKTLHSELGNGCAEQAHSRLLERFAAAVGDRKSTRLNSSHGYISYAVFCLKKKKKDRRRLAASDLLFT